MYPGTSLTRFRSLRQADQAGLAFSFVSGSELEDLHKWARFAGHEHARYRLVLPGLQVCQQPHMKIRMVCKRTHEAPTRDDQANVKNPLKRRPVSLGLLCFSRVSILAASCDSVELLSDAPGAETTNNFALVLALPTAPQSLRGLQQHRGRRLRMHL